MLVGDVAVAARVLRALDTPLRPVRLRRLIARADAAERHRAETGAAHPRWGGGSLMAAASGMERAAHPTFEDPVYCACWIMVLEALMDRHRTPPRLSA